MTFWSRHSRISRTIWNMHTIAKKKEPMKMNVRKPLWHWNVCNIPHTLA